MHPYAIFDYIGAFLRSSFAHVDNVITKGVQNNHMAAPVKVPMATNHTGTFRTVPPEPIHQHAPELFGTLRNLPNPPSGTYTNTRRNSPEPSGTFRDLPEPTFRNLPEPSGTYLLNLRQHTPEPSEIFGNVPPEPTQTHTLEPSEIFRNPLHQHTPELSGTFRNLPPKPAPATRTGTHRSLSGLKTPLAYAVGEKWLENVGLEKWCFQPK